MGITAAALRSLVPAEVTQRARLAAYRALPPGRRRRILAGILRRQGRVCERSGSPLYGSLLRSAAADVEAGGPCWRVLAGNEGPGTVLALRFMGAVHRLVLAGEAPALAPYYPSVTPAAKGGEPWPAFAETVEANVPRLRELIVQPVQTNEVSRCAALLCGFLLVARETSLPLRVLEIGASAGLNLRFDRYFYRSGSRTWGDPDSPVRLEDAFAGECPLLDVEVAVTERRGCDLGPLDVRSESTVHALESLVWADQAERFRTLAAAIDVARGVPVTVDRASAPDWLEEQLRRPGAGAATIVYQSYVQQFLSAVAAARVRRALREAGRKASRGAPLAWLRFEPENGHAAVRLTTWPGEDERVVASATPHGRDVRWLLGAG